MNKELSGDEINIFSISDQSFDQMISTLITKEVYPPVTYIALHYMMKISRSEIWVRLYFVLFGTGVCFLIYMLAKEFLDSKLAITALILGTFSPLLISTSQYVRSYIDSAFWMLLSTLFMMKIMKGKDSFTNWAGYLISASLSLYTFYFSALLIFSQAIFAVVTTFKNKKLLMKWFLAFFGVGLIFLPWLPVSIRQFHNASSIVFDWSSKGFTFGVFRIGLYARNIFSIVGFDPNFMIFQGGVTKYFPKSILLSVALIILSLGVFFTYHCYKFLKNKFSANKTFVWFLLFLIYFPMILSWSAAALLNTLPMAKYLVALHAIFLILLACFIYSLSERRRLAGNMLLALIIIIFSLRIPDAISPEFDYMKASQFLRSNLTKNDCLICIVDCQFADNNFNIIEAGNYFKLNDKRSGSLPLSERAKQELRSKIAAYEEIMFYKVYGHAEVFGANDMLDNFFKDEGYMPKVVKRIKNIDIVRYKR